RLIPIFQGLLAKAPENRYHNAREVIEALIAALGQPIAIETPLIRESFLQAAEFVGRESEMACLSEALTDVRNGKGNAWLVGGESGVGKSRLLDELRTLALVEGVIVLRSQGSTEGAPYLYWRDVIRYLCLHTDISEVEASVLKLLVPDISKLLDYGFELPDA